MVNYSALYTKLQLLLFISCHIPNISHCQQPAYYCNEPKGSYTTLAGDSSIHDCGPNGGGDSLIYYCCGGISRYCLSQEAGCFWANGNCPTQYNDYTCHIPANPHCSNSHLLAYTVDNSIQYYCNPQTYVFYTNQEPTPNPTQKPTPEPTVTNCETVGEIKHINWKELLNPANSDQVPYSSFNASFDSNSLEISFDIDLEYIGLSSDGTSDYILGTTYVVDFDSYGTSGNYIARPGNCQNRLADSFQTGSFDQWWTYSDYPNALDALGSDSYLSYPPPSEYWTLSTDPLSCSPIHYQATFSWSDLIQCTSFNGTDLMTVVDDGSSITLSGALYVNVVSPLVMQSIDSGIYRTYPLIQQDFSISISKQMNVLSSTGIQLFTASIIGIFEDETDGSFELSVLTQSADYIVLTNPNILSTPLGTATITSVTSSCLVSSSFMCDQIFTITIDQSQIPCPSADFSGLYQMAFTAACPGNEDVCNTFIDNNDGATVALQVESTFIDTTCDPLSYKVIFSGNMQFFDDVEFSITHDDDADEYIIGQSNIYVEIEVNFPEDGNFEIFGVEIENVFVCTADDSTDLAMDLDQQSGVGGCLSSNIDVDGPYDIIINGAVNSDYQAQIISNTGTTSSVVKFAFLTFDIGRSRMYVHTQLTLILTNGQRRRLEIFESDNGLNDDKKTNQIRHFIDSTRVYTSSAMLVLPISPLTMVTFIGILLFV